MDDEKKRLDTVHNEQTKLTATYTNSVAVAVFAIGGFAPPIAYLSSGGTNPTPVFVISTVCLLASAALHWMAYSGLRRLK